MGKIFETRRPAVSDLFEGAVAKRPLVLVDVPVFRNGEVVYALNLSLPPETFLTVFARQGLAGDWTAALIDRSPEP